MGIANAVTVLAESAALADVAATLIANAVDLDESSKVHRVPAVELSPDSDLGNRPVTVGVDRLSGREKQQALKGGLARAEGYMQRGLIAACYLNVQSYSASVSGIAPISLSSQRVGMKRVSLSHNSVAAENYWT
jgi:hypothetical protein